MARRVRSVSAARRATVQVSNREGDHHGQGLLLDVEGEGPVVLTCHHIVARLPSGAIYVRLPREDGSLSAPTLARYDEERSRPGTDAAVLRLEGIDVPERPLLHRLDPAEYSGSLGVTGLTHLSPTSFSATISASTRLEINVPTPDSRLPPGSKYVIQKAFRLADTTDARPGISGAVVVSNAGVLGLAQSARGTAEKHQAEVYLLPLEVWAEGWEALSALIEPFVGEGVSPYDSSLQDYLRAIRIFSTNTPYLALDEILSGAKRELHEIYVPLRARPADARGGSQSAQEKEGARDAEAGTAGEGSKGQNVRPPGEQNAQGATALPQVVTLAEMLRGVGASIGRPDVLLQGGAGAGKSTALRSITAHAWARPHLIGLSRPHLPIVVRLQVTAAVQDAPLEERLLTGLGHAGDLPLERNPPEGFFREWSSREDAPWLLLLDGLDEVAADHRDGVLRWIKGLLQMLEGQHRVLLTSRPAADRQYQELADNFTVYDVLPFDEGQQIDFARRWFADKADDFLAKVKLIGAGNLFREPLVMTPLLLTIAAAVYRRDGHLSESRQVELYSRFIDILFEEAGRRGLWGELGEEISDVTRAGLERLGLAMTERPDENTLDALGQISASFLQEELGWGEVKAETRGRLFAEVMGRRTGVLYREGDSFRWVHPVIREYLAARALDRQLRKSGNDYITVLGERLLDEGWREVLWNLHLLHREGRALTRWMSQEALDRFDAGAALLAYDCWQDSDPVTQEELKQDVISAMAGGLGDSQSGMSERGRLLRNLTRMGGEATERLITLLNEYNGLQQRLLPVWDDEKKHPDIHTEPGKRIYAGSRLRHSVIKVLGDIGDERAVGPLIALLDEKDKTDSYRWELARSARRALRCVGHTAVNPLLARISDATLPTQARVDCLRALGVVGLRTAAVEPVLDACMREGLRGGDAELLARSLWAAWRLGNRTHTVHAVSSLESDDMYVVAEAAAYLKRTTDPSAIDRLNRAFTKWLSGSDDFFPRMWILPRLAAALLATGSPKAKKTVSDFVQWGLQKRGKVLPDDALQAAGEARLNGLPRLLLEELIRRLSLPAPGAIVDRLVARLSEVWRPEQTRVLAAATQKSGKPEEGGKGFAAKLVDICVDAEAVEGEQSPLSAYLDRRQVLRMMAKCQAPDFVAQAGRLLSGGEFWLVSEVSDALWVVGDTASEDDLLVALNDFNRPSAQADRPMPEEYDVLRALGTCCTERGAQAIIHFIRENPNLSIYLPEEVLCTLVRRTVLDVDTLERMAQDSMGTHEYIRRACVLALGFLDAPRFTPVFLHAVASESDEQARGFAASFLGEATTDRSRVVEALRALLITDSAFLAERATQSLVRLGERESLGLIESTIERFGRADTASGLLRAVARFRTPSTLMLLEKLRIKTRAHHYLHTEEEIIAAFGEFYRTHTQAREVVDAQLEHSGSAFDSGKQRVAVRVLATHNPNSLLQRVIRLYDEDRFDSSACMALINNAPRLSRSGRVDQTLLVEIMKRLLCEEDLTIREWAGESLQFVAASLRPRIYEELRAMDSEWAQGCAVYSLGFWDSNEEIIKSARFDASSVVRHLAYTAASLRSKRPALRKIARAFRTSRGVPRLSAYLGLVDQAPDSLVDTLYRDIKKDDPAQIYLRELEEAVERRVKEDRKKRLKEEQDAICEKVRHTGFK